MDVGQMQLNLFGEITEESIQKETENVISDSYISESKAMELLGLSRHSFEKIIDSGAITPQIISGKKCYDVAQLKAFMETETYKELVQGVVDPRNSLNDLTGKDWLPETKSFFIKKVLEQIALKRKLKNFIQRHIHSWILDILYASKTWDERSRPAWWSRLNGKGL